MNLAWRFENPVFSLTMSQRWRRVGKTCIAVILQCALLLVICQLLMRAKLGQVANLIFLAEAFLILIVSPYLACSTLNRHHKLRMSDTILLLSPIRSRSILPRLLFESQIYSLCFIGVTLVVFTISAGEILRYKVILLHVVFIVFIFSGASIAALVWNFFRHTLFAVETVYLLWAFLIGGVFLLSPLEAYLENLQPMISPFLHINPLIAVCHLLEMDIFRTPALYELTPMPSYLFVYPAWYQVCGWQALIGCLCCVLASQKMSK
ncbi:MAG: hypothetical protein OXP71_02955 [Candidatus Poribacteria bacterium]|nr:hypothetical protein [Candidatus Poribacteria bacterium]